MLGTIELTPDQNQRNIYHNLSFITSVRDVQQMRAYARVFIFQCDCFMKKFQVHENLNYVTTEAL